jgi:hypothetical protein
LKREKLKDRRARVNKQLKEKTTEALRATLPITGIVLLLSMTIAPMPIGSMMLFLFGALMLIVGTGIFSLGADIAMIPMGEGMGVQISKSKKVIVAGILCFLIGTVITMAEPDLTVLANQVPAIDNFMLIAVVSIGVGMFLTVALLRVFHRVPLNWLLLFFYAGVFVLTIFAPDDFLAVAFDSGGVTTGPITVPFIMALGIGLSALRSDKASKEDSFGWVALCSIGPILAVLLLSIIYNPSTADYRFITVPDVRTTAEVAKQFAVGLPQYMKEVAISILPVILLFFVFQVVTRRFQKGQIKKMIVGLVYTWVGLVLFLTGVNVGFLPAGHYIGTLLGGGEFKWLLVPIGMVMGYFIVEAEPAVHVLKKQVEEISNGSISQRALQKSLSIGVAFAVGIGMLRVLTGVSIFYFLLPGYAIAIVLSFIVRRFFTAIAFDSGGVASGPMTATFLLPFALGATEAVGGNILKDAFGIVAMVAMTPLITIQVLGFISQRKQARRQKEEPQTGLRALAASMVYYEEVNAHAP